MRKYALMFGFKQSDPDTVGWLKLGKKYEIVDDESEATEFPLKLRSKKFKTPDFLCKFFNEEEELSDWKFHVVKRQKS